ncbi:MAG: LysR substrate-binding domain-containing protein [Lysobacterales bacterium]
MSEITLEGLEVLDAIDRKGSFAAAAASLYRVPSKITYTVNRLEADLGVTLFQRQGRRAVMTPAGRLLLEQGREILDATARLVETTRQKDRGWESRLRIAIDTVLDEDYLSPHLLAFCEMRPDTEIEITQEVLGGTWEAIQLERVDLAIGAPDEAVDKLGITSRPLVDIPWVFAVSPDHPLATHEGPVPDEERVKHRAVVVKDSSRERPARTLRVFEKQQRLIVPTIHHKIAAQRAGLGAGFLPRFRVENLLLSGELIALDTEAGLISNHLHIAWRTVNKGKALRWFVERIVRKG